MDEKVENYIIDLIFATRNPEKYKLKDVDGLIQYGASPRASINLNLASRGHAFLQHRAYVTPEDVRAMAMDVLRHRLILTYEAEAENVSPEDVIERILSTVQVP
jgi:MoxR-like ATPase